LRRRPRRAAILAALSLLPATSTAVLAAQTSAHAAPDPTVNARGWGYNYYGYIGNGDTTNVTTSPFPYPRDPGGIGQPETPETYVTQIVPVAEVCAS
jgi:hypothetical protein